MLSTMSAIDLCWHNWHPLALCCSCLAKATGKSKASGLADIPATDTKAQGIVKNNEKHVEESRTKGETDGINMHRQNKETFIVPTPFWNVCASTIYPFLFFHGFFILVSLAACDTCSLLCFRRWWNACRTVRWISLRSWAPPCVKSRWVALGGNATEWEDWQKDEGHLKGATDSNRLCKFDQTFIR